MALTATLFDSTSPLSWYGRVILYFDYLECFRAFFVVFTRLAHCVFWVLGRAEIIFVTREPKLKIAVFTPQDGAAQVRS